MSRVGVSPCQGSFGVLQVISSGALLLIGNLAISSSQLLKLNPSSPSSLLPNEHYCLPT